MKSWNVADALIGLICSGSIMSATAGLAQIPGDRMQPDVSAAYANLPLSFESNQGQAGSSIQFVSRGAGYTVFLRPNEAVLTLSGGAGQGYGIQKASAKDKMRAPNSPSHTASALRLRLVGADPRAEASPQDPQITRTNYFLGNDPAKWHTNISNFGRVHYSSVYPGIDLVYYGSGQRLEHDFVVAPHADPRRIRIDLDGARNVRIDSATGDLVVTLEAGSLRLLKPVSYQISEKASTDQAHRGRVESSFQLLGKNVFGFSIGSYNRAKPLIIDPVLSYSTYLGSQTYNTYNTGRAIAVDPSGAAYITGETLSYGFPTTPGAFQTQNKDPEDEEAPTSFVSKMNSTGTALVYSTFLGGSVSDTGTGITVDRAGNAYVTGYTQSPDFPVTPGALQTINHEAARPESTFTCFVSKLNPLGASLVFSTFLGGSGGSGPEPGDSCSSITLDSLGNVVVGGSTTSNDFPVTKGAYQTTNNELSLSTGFVSKLNSAGTALVFSTFLGGSQAQDSVSGIALDSSNFIYTTGSTTAANFPTTRGAYQTTNPGGTMAFVTKLNPAGTSLTYSTLLGGQMASSYAAANAIAVDSSGSAYVGGTATSTDFPVTSGAFQDRTSRGTTGFVTKLNQAGTALSYSTLLGGTGNSNPYGSTYDAVTGIAVDSAGNAYLTGRTQSSDFPVTSTALEATNPSYYFDGNEGVLSSSFVTELNSTGTGLVYSTFLGGFENGGSDGAANGIALGASGTVYITGHTASTNFPVSAQAFQNSPSGAGFVTRLPLAALLTGAGTTTSLSFSNGVVSIKGVPSTFTAAVASIGANTIPTGVVDFFIDGVSFGSASLDSNGQARFPMPDQTAFDHIASVQYLGNANSVFSAANFSFQLLDSELRYLSGNQFHVYGTPFAAPLKAQLTDAAGHSLAYSGVPVTFSGAGLAFSATAVVTDANGQAETTATPIQIGNLTATASNVDGLGSAAFSLTVTKATLNVGAKTVSTTYGQTPLNPTAFSLSGFVNGDTASAVSGAPVLTTSVTARTPVGFYPIGIQLGTLAAANYAFSVNTAAPGYMTVIKAPLTIHPASFTIHAGDPLPAFTYTLSGFQNGDTASVVSGAPVLTTTATSTSTPGRFYIIGATGTLTATNYSFVENLPAYGFLTILP